MLHPLLTEYLAREKRRDNTVELHPRRSMVGGRQARDTGKPLLPAAALMFSEWLTAKAMIQSASPASLLAVLVLPSVVPA